MQRVIIRKNKFLRKTAGKGEGGSIFWPPQPQMVVLLTGLYWTPHFWTLLSYTQCIFSGFCCAMQTTCTFLSFKKWIFSALYSRDSETVFKEKHSLWDPLAELTMTHLILKSTP
jgi:hypothetical protein